MARLKRELQCYKVVPGMESKRSEAGGQLGHQTTLGLQAGHPGCSHRKKDQQSSVSNAIAMSLWTEAVLTCILLDVGGMMFAVCPKVSFQVTPHNPDKLRIDKGVPCSDFLRCS